LKQRSASVISSSGRSEKLNKNNFNGVSLRIANGGKSVVRERVALVEAFPKDKDNFVWESVQLAVKDNDALCLALKGMENDTGLQESLIEYVRFFYTFSWCSGH
jgi:hypothetical protein